MKITAIEIKHYLLPLDPPFKAAWDPSPRKKFAASIVRVNTDEGITGIGETDVNPWIARACIEARGTHTMGLGLKEMLIGEDPLQPEVLWEKLYTGSAMNGRRSLKNGAGSAISASHRINHRPTGTAQKETFCLMVQGYGRI